MSGDQAPMNHLRHNILSQEKPFMFSYDIKKMVVPSLTIIEDEDDANISDFEEEEYNPSTINNGMISEQSV